MIVRSGRNDGKTLGLLLHKIYYIRSVVGTEIAHLNRAVITVDPKESVDKSDR